ncbi:hypothetical protein EV426DRAFT_574030 [Tirmania nivea]|nr:hypothetical protein EV426DRAFT_574030 [Tirmania nivea]
MPSESQKSTRQRTWPKEDMERLVCWMEDNQEKLRGKQAAWHKDVKEQVFAEDPDITVNRIRDKAQNMKKAWSDARKLREQSGSGVRAEDQVSSFNALLESKCPLFWRLDDIWGTRPNIIPIIIADSTQDPTESQSELLKKDESDNDVLEWDETPPPPKAVQNSKRPKKLGGGGIKGGEFSKIMEDRALIQQEKEEHRNKLELEIHKDRMAAEDRRLEAENRRFEQQLQAQEKIMQMQLEAQAKQFELFIKMMATKNPPLDPSS